VSPGCNVTSLGKYDRKATEGEALADASTPTDTVSAPPLLLLAADVADFLLSLLHAASSTTPTATSANHRLVIVSPTPPVSDRLPKAALPWAGAQSARDRVVVHGFSS
jgi:hypothetical protein